MVLQAGAVLAGPGYIKLKTRMNKCVRTIFFANSRDNAMPYFRLLENLTRKHLQIQSSHFPT